MLIQCLHTASSVPNEPLKPEQGAKAMFGIEHQIVQLTQFGEGLGNCFFFDARAARGFIFRLVPKVLPF